MVKPSYSFAKRQRKIAKKRKPSTDGGRDYSGPSYRDVQGLILGFAYRCAAWHSHLSSCISSQTMQVNGWTN